MAARCCGQSDPEIIRRNIIPNAVGPIVVRANGCVSEAILATAALCFLGMGPQPPAPEWGAMLSGARVCVDSTTRRRCTGTRYRRDRPRVQHCR